MADEKKSYHVHSPVLHDKEYKRGERISLTEKEAEPLLQVKAIGHKAPKNADEVEDAFDGQNPAAQSTATTPVKLAADMTRPELLVHARDVLKLEFAGNISNADLLSLVHKAEKK